MSGIAYRGGYRYQNAADYSCATGWQLPFAVSNRYARLDCKGILTIREGYAWDGPSGGMVDTKSAMRPSLEHDCLYQFLREGLLPQHWRDKADQRFRDEYLKDAMIGNARRNKVFAAIALPVIKARAWGAYHALRLGGGPSADPANDRPILSAP